MGTYMNPVSDIQTEAILDSLNYNEETGIFTWKKSRGNQKAGSQAGTIDGHGYVCIQINRKPHRAHNIAWRFVHGVWPKYSIDHINRDRADNRIINLRDIPFNENLANSPRSKGGKIDAIQIGGDHYKNHAYQHWNMVCDTDLPYVLGCATKYVSRWENKNGIEDLRKSIHYIEKADQEVIFAENSDEFTSYYRLFLTQFGEFEQQVLEFIYEGLYSEAVELIRDRIDEAECGPTANYVDPDKNYIRG